MEMYYNKRWVIPTHRQRRNRTRIDTAKGRMNHSEHISYGIQSSHQFYFILRQNFRGCHGDEGCKQEALTETEEK
jgi:hypothetical protein